MEKKARAVNTKRVYLVRLSCLVGIGCLLMLFSSCQYINRSLEQGVEIEVLRKMLIRYSEKMDTMSARIDRLEEQLLQTRRSADALQERVDKNYLLLLTAQSSLTYWEYLNTPPDFSALLQISKTIPDMAAIEEMVRERIAAEMARFRMETSSSDRKETTIQDTVPQASFQERELLLQSELNQLKEDYRQLRWLNYRDNPKLTDPFSLDDLSLVLGGKIEYTIQSGDTLSHIAQAFGLGAEGVKTLMAENKIQDARTIRSGSIIRIPLPPLQERITVPLAGRNRLAPEDILRFFGESTDSGISRGLSFRVWQNQTIVSCLPGRVIDVGATYIVIYHGNGLKGIYNRLEELTVNKGDWVMSGQALGVCRPPEFRLEIMINFEYRDPMLLFLQNMGDFQVTFYTEWDDGNLPFFPYFRRTKEGSFAKEWYSVAADPALLPPGTMVYLPQLRSTPSRGLFVVEDVGSAIRSKKLDVYIRDIREAAKLKMTTGVYRFGH